VLIGFLVAPQAMHRWVIGSQKRGGSLEWPILFVGIMSMVAMVVIRLATVRAVKPMPLPSGELLERILALARHAGVSVSQVLVARTERDRVANALVTQSGTVVLTNYLGR
jgi:hypothetical protein